MKRKQFINFKGALGAFTVTGGAFWFLQFVMGIPKLVIIINVG